MRAIFYDEPIPEVGDALIEGERARHLIKSSRVRKNEKVLLLNGKGQVACAHIVEITKKEVIVQIESIEIMPRLHEIDLIVCLPKKDAFEDIIRSAMELGVGRIIPCYSEYSIRNFKYLERFDKIIESAMIQSNNPYQIKIEDVVEFNEIEQIISEYKNTFYFSSQTKLKGGVASSGRSVIIIGPEGGMSLSEEESLTSNADISLIHLNCPILKAQTAVSAGVGFLLSSFTLNG